MYTGHRTLEATAPSPSGVIPKLTPHLCHQGHSTTLLGRRFWLCGREGTRGLPIMGSLSWARPRQLPCWEVGPYIQCNAMPDSVSAAQMLCEPNTAQRSCKPVPGTHVHSSQDLSVNLWRHKGFSIANLPPSDCSPQRMVPLGTQHVVCVRRLDIQQMR